jgi:hypothetical protein
MFIKMNNKIVRISVMRVMIVLLCNKTTSTPNELNEVVISDSKFVGKEKSGKVIVKLRLRNCLRNQESLAILSTVAGLEINGNQSSAKP